ncbi:MAG: LysM peptidoglycan-binding domain-containing protein [Chloroflexi bacterium]|nr:LysM peptidoglycan-binding domain-containing protein [Chloroflexota bacterium]
MRSPDILRLIVLAAVLAGCNLTTAPPTPTLAPTQPPTFAPIITPLPVDVTPINPDCPQTPNNWIPYTVEEGDNLSTLAEQTGSTVTELMANNCLENPDQLFAGFVIYLPPVISP